MKPHVRTLMQTYDAAPPKSQALMEICTLDGWSQAWEVIRERLSDLEFPEKIAIFREISDQVLDCLRHQSALVQKLKREKAN